MIVTWLLSFFTSENKKPIIVALCVVVALIGLSWFWYNAGYDKAELIGRAEIATLRQEYSAASANATTEAYQKIQSEMRRADKISSELVTARNRLAQLKKEITGGIPYAVAHNQPCTLGPDALRVLSQAFYGVRPGTMPEGFGSTGIEKQPGEAAAAGEGIRAGASVADLLHWGRDMGVYVQELEAQRDGLKALLTEGE